VYYITLKGVYQLKRRTLRLAIVDDEEEARVDAKKGLNQTLELPDV